MLYRLREDEGDDWLSGTWISADGETRTLKGGEIELIVLSERSIDIDAQTTIELPLEWSIKLPQLDRQWCRMSFSWIGTQAPKQAKGAHGRAPL